MIHLLILEDDVLEARRYKRHFQNYSDNVTAQILSNESQLEDQFQSHIIPDIVVLDYYISLDENRTSHKYISQIKKKYPAATIIMCSQLNSVDIVFQCIQEGADEYLCKQDLDTDRFYAKIKTTHENVLVKKGLHERNFLSSHFWVGKTLNGIAQRITKIVDSAVRVVLIEGESGTGKEVVAEMFHHNFLITRKNIPFYKINCASIPENLIESELFGHKKGAFTSAIADKKGVFEVASSGWLFMDEVSSLSLPAQAAVLRAIENQEITAVGDTKSKKIDVKILCATNISLKKMVSQHKFRVDLWQRLQECEIQLPPLRDRPHELPQLIQHFAAEMDGGPYSVDDTAMKVLQNYSWKEGNVRELRNCLRAMTENHCEKSLSALSIPERIWKQSFPSDYKTHETPDVCSPQKSKQFDFLLKDDKHFKSWKHIEDELFSEIFKRAEQAGKTKQNLAKELGLGRNTLYRILERISGK